jgi:SAM-dependent methyltransferase
LLERANVVAGKKLVDVGCGFGLEAIVLSCLIPDGAKVIGIDHNEEKIRLAGRLAEDVGTRNIEFQLQRGEELYENAWADVVLCRDVVSHVYDVNEFLEPLRRMLRAGGVLYIIDDRNALSLPTVLRTRKLQKEADRGVPDPDRGLKNNYFDLRRKLISDHFEFSSDVLDRYALQTSGLWGEEILSFVRKAENGEPVKQPRFKYVNPVTGESYERLYNPFFLKRLLEGKGFSVSIDRPFFGFSSDDRGTKKLAAWFIEKAHPLSLLFTPIYFVKGVKEA